MKKTRKILSVVLFVLFSSCLYGKGLKVSVKAEEGSLAFSYIYVNGTITCVADSLGVAYLPIDNINIGDSISASFLGFTSSGIVYDSVVAASKEVEINLIATFTADEVVVSVDVMELYKKFVRKKQYLKNSGRRFHFNFSSNRVNDENVSVKNRTGEVSFQWYPPLRLYKFPKFKVEGDTTNLRDDLVHAFILTMYPAQTVTHSRFIGITEFYRRRGYSTRISYKGIRDDYRIFIFTFKNDYISHQEMFCFDKDSGFLKYFERHGTEKIPNGEIGSYLGKANFRNERNSLYIVDGSIHLETSNKSRGSYDIKIWNVNSEALGFRFIDLKKHKFEEGVNAFKLKLPRFPSFWE